MRSAIELARERVRDGLPLRAPIAVVGYVARKPSADAPGRRSATGVGRRRRLPRRTRRRPPRRSACTTTTSRRSATS